MTRRAPVRISGTGAGEAAVEITVVIPVYGPGPHLERVVGALRRQQPPVGRIVVSHSGAGDPSARFAGADGVTVLHAPERLYAGAARNRGLALATTEWVAFVDEDVIVDDGWHTALQDAIGRGEADCIVGSIGYAETGGYWGMSLWFSEFGSVHPYLRRRPIPSGASANIAARRACLRKVDGFPADWRTGEDALLQARLRQAGCEIVFEPSIQVRHFNKNGIGHLIRYNYLLGRNSARVRKIHGGLQGAKAVANGQCFRCSWPRRGSSNCTSGYGWPPTVPWRRSSGIHQELLSDSFAWNAGFSVEAFGRGGREGVAAIL